MSGRTGLPVQIVEAGNFSTFEKPDRIFFDNGARSRLVRPARALASWITKGRLMSQAAKPPGPAANPPIPKTTLGCHRLTMFNACHNALNKTKGKTIRRRQDVPIQALASRHSRRNPASGTSRDSSPLLVPSQTTSTFRSRSASAMLNAGYT